MLEGKGKKVVVAMSGGVDSSVAAAILKDRGYQVIGCFMRLGSEHEAEIADGYDNMAGGCDPNKAKAHHQGCCSVNDASDARLVAAMLDVPFYVVNFKKDFGRIIDYFVDEYNAGRTPNPCVRCNDWLKFGKLYAYAQSIDADYVASGHYARIDRSTGPARLLRGVDHGKDQSYVLFGSPRDRLDHMLLPIGEMHKAQVRELARRYQLPVFDKPDSQEICFVPDNDYARLVKRRSPGQMREGAILNRHGQPVGVHQGQQHFTIGQRRGVGVALGYPIYVVEKDAQANTVTIGEKKDLLSSGCLADQANWLSPVFETWQPCQVKVRYNSEPQPGRVRATGQDALAVQFDRPLSAVTPGQAVVCYHDDQVLCGGWITEAHKVD